MRESDKGGRRYIEHVISERNITDCDELERVVGAIVAVRCDIELLEECYEEVEAGDVGIEPGSLEWQGLCSMLMDYLADDARSCAAVLGVSPSDTVHIAWCCHVENRDEEGKGTSPYVEAMVASMVDRMGRKDER